MALDDLEGVNDGKDVQPDNYDDESKNHYIASGWVEIELPDYAISEGVADEYDVSRALVTIQFDVSVYAYDGDEYKHKIRDKVEERARNIADDVGHGINRYSHELDQINIRRGLQ